MPATPTSKAKMTLSEARVAGANGGQASGGQANDVGSDGEGSSPLYHDCETPRDYVALSVTGPQAATHSNQNSAHNSNGAHTSEAAPNSDDALNGGGYVTGGGRAASSSEVSSNLTSLDSSVGLSPSSGLSLGSPADSPLSSASPPSALSPGSDLQPHATRRGLAGQAINDIVDSGDDGTPLSSLPSKSHSNPNSNTVSSVSSASGYTLTTAAGTAVPSAQTLINDAPSVSASPDASAEVIPRIAVDVGSAQTFLDPRVNSLKSLRSPRRMKRPNSLSKAAAEKIPETTSLCTTDRPLTINEGREGAEGEKESKGRRYLVGVKAAPSTCSNRGYPGADGRRASAADGSSQATVQGPRENDLFGSSVSGAASETISGSLGGDTGRRKRGHLSLTGRNVEDAEEEEDMSAINALTPLLYKNPRGAGDGVTNYVDRSGGRHANAEVALVGSSSGRQHFDSAQSQAEGRGAAGDTGGPGDMRRRSTSGTRGNRGNGGIEGFGGIEGISGEVSEEVPIGRMKQRYYGPFVCRALCSAYLAVMLPLSFVMSLLTQVSFWITLWPIFLLFPSFKFRLMGLTFRFYQNCAAFYLNPFWSFQRIDVPPSAPHAHSNANRVKLGLRSHTESNSDSDSGSNSDGNRRGRRGDSGGSRAKRLEEGRGRGEGIHGGIQADIQDEEGRKHEKKLRDQARERATADGRTLIMCNHVTAADPWICNRAFFPWEYKWVYKADLQKIPVAGQVVQLAYDHALHFTNQQGGWGTRPGAVKAMMARVKQMGEDYKVGTVVFPEGTRSRTGQLQPFKDGFFKFAIENDWQVIPAVAHNNQALWPLGSMLLGVGKVYFAIGDPMRARPDETASEFKRRVREEMIRMLRHMPLYDPAYDTPLPHDAVIAKRGQGMVGALDTPQPASTLPAP